jgi:Ca2+-binding EF-hand superfamily protein
MCYALNPSASPAVLSADAESDANTMCIAYYMRNVSSKADMLVNFSNAQFLDFMALVLSFLEEESIRRRNSGEDVVTYDEEGTSEPDDAKSEESKNANLRSFSEDEASDECIPYLDDKQYPPSPVVLELRAASSVLGLEHYSADDLIDKLGGESTAGRLDHHGWARWLGTVFQVGKVSEFDIDLAIFIGHKIFNAFQHDEQRTVRFSHLAIGLAFLCTKSPLEERLMVAFTLADEDSDGFLTFHDFCTLIKSVLTVISVCSKLIAGKISTLNVTLAELSREAALQGMKALGLEENDDINLEMLSDLTEDFLKLTAFV